MIVEQIIAMRMSIVMHVSLYNDMVKIDSQYSTDSQMDIYL